MKYICKVCPEKENTGDPCTLDAGDNDLPPNSCPFDGKRDAQWKEMKK